MATRFGKKEEQSRGSRLKAATFPHRQWWPNIDDAQQAKLPQNNTAKLKEGLHPALASQTDESLQKPGFKPSCETTTVSDITADTEAQPQATFDWSRLLLEGLPGAQGSSSAQVDTSYGQPMSNSDSKKGLSASDQSKRADEVDALLSKTIRPSDSPDLLLNQSKSAAAERRTIQDQTCLDGSQIEQGSTLVDWGNFFNLRKSVTDDQQNPRLDRDSTNGKAVTNPKDASQQIGQNLPGENVTLARSRHDSDMAELRAAAGLTTAVPPQSHASSQQAVRLEQDSGEELDFWAKIINSVPQGETAAGKRHIRTAKDRARSPVKASGSPRRASLTRYKAGPRGRDSIKPEGGSQGQDTVGRAMEARSDKHTGESGTGKSAGRSHSTIKKGAGPSRLAPRRPGAAAIDRLWGDKSDAFRSEQRLTQATAPVPLQPKRLIQRSDDLAEIIDQNGSSRPGQETRSRKRQGLRAVHKARLNVLSKQSRSAAEQPIHEQNEIESEVDDDQPSSSEEKRGLGNALGRGEQDGVARSSKLVRDSNMQPGSPSVSRMLAEFMGYGSKPVTNTTQSLQNEDRTDSRQTEPNLLTSEFRRQLDLDEKAERLSEPSVLDNTTSESEAGTQHSEESAHYCSSSQARDKPGRQESSELELVGESLSEASADEADMRHHPTTASGNEDRVPQRRIFKLPNREVLDPPKPQRSPLQKPGRAKRPIFQMDKQKASAQHVSHTAEGHSLSEGPDTGQSSADVSGDEKIVRVPGKSISYRIFDVTPEAMKRAESAIRAVYPHIEPSFLRISIEAHNGDPEASLAFLHDAFQDSRNKPDSRKTLGLVPNNVKDDSNIQKEFELASVANDPTPAELISKAKSADAKRQADSRTQKNKQEETAFFDQPLSFDEGLAKQIFGSNQRGLGQQGSVPASTFQMPPRYDGYSENETALGLIATPAEAIGLAICGAKTAAAERQKLRAEEEVFRAQWDHQTALAKMYREASNQEARLGRAELAQELRNRAEHHLLKVRDLRQSCNEKAFAASMFGISNTIKIDLHGMTVAEAIQLLHKHVTSLRSMGSPCTLQVVTGIGKHSEGGIARIQPAVVAYILENKLLAQAANNKGMFNILLNSE